MALVTVRLHGELKRFEPTAPLHVGSVAEIVSALAANDSTFRPYMVEAANQGASYHILINNDRDISAEQIYDPLANGFTIDVVPVIEGESNTLKIIAGVILIAVGIFTGGVGFISGATLILMGTTLALSGVVGLFNQPKNDVSDKDDEEQKSFVFNGSVNSNPTNARIPVVLGAGYKGKGIIVGSVTISASIRSYIVENDDDDD